ncbi:MAG: 4'-phosphopantetheinyl transferase superfamily protein [Saprospiraceae bacterium]
MPLLLTTHPFPESTFGLWQVLETEAFFRDQLRLSPVEENELAKYQLALRRREWLAVRWLVHLLSDQPVRLPLTKDTFAKPFFPDDAGQICSLSHSQGLVGALLAKKESGAVGCDLQVLVDKMPRLAPRFLNPVEMEFVGQQTLADQFDLVHLLWTAKESLYKAYGIKELDFRAHLQVAPFSWDGYAATTTGTIVKNDFRQAFQLWMEKKELPDGTTYVWTVCQFVSS